MADSIEAVRGIAEIEVPKHRKLVVITLLLVAVVSCSAAGLYYHAQQRNEAVTAMPQSVKGTARVVAPPATHNKTSESSAVYQDSRKLGPGITINPLENFKTSLRRELAAQLAASYPQLPDMTSETANTSDPVYATSVFRFVDAAENAASADQPAMLLAADFMLHALWCPTEESDGCAQLKKQFADHKLTFSYSELGGGYYYQHELLWRVWRTYPDTRSGEQALLLLLNHGWDTSSTCAAGGDQFREVIREGEGFLSRKPTSPYRPYVLHLVGQAYATWWTLSNPPADGMEDYVEPREYKDGSEEARKKAIGYFEQVTQVAPGTDLAEYAYQILPSLREGRLTEDGYRFFCIYD